MSDAHTDQLLIPPRILPRDLVDCCIGPVVGTLTALVLFGIPATVAFLITRSETTAFITFCAASGVFLCFSVRRISVSPSGIRFHRLFGTPAFLPWERISSIAVASRREVVLRGWLWPPFPARESTASLTALQHFRITWDGGFCYYPPADATAFEVYVLTHLPPQNI